MKKLILNSLFFFGLQLILSTNLTAQNLQFNQVFYNTYGPGNADNNQSTPMFSGAFTVGPNQVLKVISVYATSFDAQMGTVPYSHFVSWIAIDGIIMNSGYNLECWYPTGTYSVNGYEAFANISSGSFRGMISGILYDIVP